MNNVLIKQITKIITFFGGLYFFLFFLLPENFLTQVGISEHHSSISKGFIVIGAMAFGIGIIQLITVHLKKIARSDKDSKYSLILLASMLITSVVGILEWRATLLNTQPNKYEFLARLINDGLFVPLGSSMFALLAFYIASASYRAFRIKNWESGLLMIAAFLVVLGQTSLGAWLFSDLSALRNWLLTVPSTATFRGIAIGASIASLVLSIRIWLSLGEQDGQ
jgi:hypothetical protein